MSGPTDVESSTRLPKAAAPAGSVLSRNGFGWPLANEAERFLRDRTTAFLEANGFGRRLALRMREETATDFFEWIDHLALSPGEQEALREAGFVQDNDAETPNGEAAYEHPRATLPRILIRPGKKQHPSMIALRPEFVADFMAHHNIPGEPEGEPFSRYRRIIVAEENETTLEAVERHGYRSLVPAPLKSGELEAIIKARELWRTRRRMFANDAEGFAVANKILERVLKLVGQDVACQLFFEAEREYWESRNRAGQI